MHPSGKDALTGTVGMPGRGKQGCCVICSRTSSLEIQLLHQSQEQNLHPLFFFRTLLPLVKGIVLESGALPQLEGVLGGCTFRTSRNTAAMCRQTESPILTRHSANTFYKQQECPDQRVLQEVLEGSLRNLIFALICSDSLVQHFLLRPG